MSTPFPVLTDMSPDAAGYGIFGTERGWELHALFLPGPSLSAIAQTLVGLLPLQSFGWCKEKGFWNV